MCHRSITCLSSLLIIIFQAVIVLVQGHPRSMFHCLRQHHNIATKSPQLPIIQIPVFYSKQTLFPKCEDEPTVCCPTFYVPNPETLYTLGMLKIFITKSNDIKMNIALLLDKYGSITQSSRKSIVHQGGNNNGKAAK